MAHVRQSRSDSGLDFKVKVPKTFSVVPSRLEADELGRLLSVETVLRCVVDDLGLSSRCRAETVWPRRDGRGGR